MSTRPSGLRLLFLADTHLGFDLPVRPRTERRRRGPDFFANFRRVLADARRQQVDLVLHGGDLFFRSKVPGAIVDEVYAELLALAEHGIPLVIVPGNHERSRLPTSLFLRHPNTHVFDGPTTFRFDLGGARVALAGFPTVRKNIRSDFRKTLEATGWKDDLADVRLLCLHQTIEGATVGSSGYTFRNGRDVIRQRDLPSSFHAVLAGHIHRHQVLRVKRSGDCALPVIYPGSTERTSFAEADETKGYCLLDFGPSAAGAWRLEGTEFVPLPSRPMVTVALPPGLKPAEVPGFLRHAVRDMPGDAVVRFTCPETVSLETRRAFSSARLARHLPRTLNYQFASGFFRRAPRQALTRSRSGAGLARQIRKTVPHAPGVYAFLSDAGRPLYVGKSINLRKRMGSYFREDTHDAESRLRRLVAGTRGFAWWRTRTELLALLLEDVLIKQHLPPMNTRQREFAENRYLELTDAEFPALTVAEHVEDFRTREVYGPMKDKYSAASLQRVLHDALGIRTCTEERPTRRCVDYDIGRCAGPCREATTRREYAKIVSLVRSFLRGDAETIAARLADARDRAAAERRYEEAARLRDAVDTCRRYGVHRRFAVQFAGGECRFRCPVDDIEYRFMKGALVEPRDVVVACGRGGQGSDHDSFDPDAVGRNAIDALRRQPSADHRFLADRSRIVCNWVNGRGGDDVHAAPTDEPEPVTSDYW